MSSTNQPGKATRNFVMPVGGFHARPVMLLVDVANRFVSDLVLERKGEKYDCKAVSQLIEATLTEGETFTVHAYGGDCTDALDAIGKTLSDIAVMDRAASEEIRRETAEREIASVRKMAANFAWILSQPR
jgi:phosphotransferase system HPr (HPr) family protein